MESLSYELIDKKGKLDNESIQNIGIGTLAGVAGGLIAGKGAIHGNKYMERQTTRFVKHVASDGLKKSATYLYKMTANYSKQFIKPAIKSIIKGTIGYKAVEAIF